MGERDWCGILKAIPRLVNEKANVHMVREVKDEQIMQAVFELGVLNPC